MDTLYMVLEMVQMLELQRPLLALRVVAQHPLRAAQLSRMLPVEMVKHYRRSTVLERPLLLG